MTKVVIKVAWACVEHNKLLVTRSHDQPAHTWYNAGGKPEPGETKLEALVREVKEETTVDIIPESIQYIDCYQSPGVGKAAGKETHLYCYFAKYRGTIQVPRDSEGYPTSEIVEIGWLPYASKHLLPPSGQVLMDYLHNHRWLVG